LKSMRESEGGIRLQTGSPPLTFGILTRTQKTLFSFPSFGPLPNLRVMVAILLFRMNNTLNGPNQLSVNTRSATFYRFISYCFTLKYTNNVSTVSCATKSHTLVYFF